MENLKETYTKSEQTNNANATSHYTLMTVGIVIGMAGVLLRFAGTWTFIDVISNVLLIIGAAIALKSVFNILK
ncbi:MAG TPA: hypothetical protein VNI52_11830 [Sphingobacteriaceae bacterium]|nr:hypothetical protein [Sphingobacteriaceae bacterium]